MVKYKSADNYVGRPQYISDEIIGRWSSFWCSLCGFERFHSGSSNTQKRTCWSWSLITCNWCIIAFSRCCLSSTVGADPITDRILSMTSPVTWRHPTSGAARSSPFPLPFAWSEYPLTSGSHRTSDSGAGRRWFEYRRAGTALRFLADIVGLPQSKTRQVRSVTGRGSVGVTSPTWRRINNYSTTQRPLLLLAKPAVQPQNHQIY